MTPEAFRAKYERLREQLKEQPPECLEGLDAGSRLCQELLAKLPEPQGTYDAQMHDFVHGELEKRVEKISECLRLMLPTAFKLPVQYGLTLIEVAQTAILALKSDRLMMGLADEVMRVREKSEA